MSCLKKDAPPDLIVVVSAVERQADEAWTTVELLNQPAGVAVWALLTKGIEEVELEQAARGSDTPHFHAVLVNLGRLLPTAIKAAMKYCPSSDATGERDWTHSIRRSVDEALALAKAYAHFEVCFQAFHKNAEPVEVIAASLLRFGGGVPARQRQVRAFQQGRRPSSGGFAAVRPQPRPASEAVDATFEKVLRASLQVSALSFSYGEPWDLWRLLLPDCAARLSALARRPDELSVGEYCIGEFNAAYAALIAICSAHESLCFRWGRAFGRYPTESAVLVKRREAWADVLSELSGVDRTKCLAIVADLTFAPTRSVDLHVYPFVPLDASGHVLAVAPPFPLHSRHDENILRVCSQRRPGIFDETSLAKQVEMLNDVVVVGARFAAQGPIMLPKPVPDIDCLLVDESASTVVIAELKWIRKPIRPAESVDRDADFLKGVDQLEQIKMFLRANPDHLKSIGKLPRPLSEYKHVHYMLVPRDHWRWVEPVDGFAVVEYETLLKALKRDGDLAITIGELLHYEWLPVEGRDFRVQYDRTTVNGVSSESAVYYATGSS